MENVLQYNPLVGSSYKELPDFIKNTKSIINIKNTDDKCFIWSCLASRKNVPKNAERVKQYEPFLNEFKYDDKDMPMTINKISKFEKDNNVNVNVYMLESETSKTKIPIHISKQKNNELINLFLHDGHYSWIKTFSRFCGGQQEYNCPRCIKGYKNTLCYKNHIEMCQDLNENGSATKMPIEGSFTKFNDYRKKKRVPVVMYADFESSLMPLMVNKKII